MRNKIKKKKENIWKRKESSRSIPPESREDSAGTAAAGSRLRWRKSLNRKGGGESAVKKEGVKTGGEGRAPEKRWRMKTTLLAVALLASLAALLWIYTGTGVLNVRHIEIRGNQKLDAGYLESLTGITSDTHLLKMDVKAVERALCSEPYIEKVTISRRFPATVILEIDERESQGMMIQNGKYHLVDNSGYILESLAEIPQGMVEIRDIETPLLFPGKEISGEDFTSAMALLASLPPELKGITEAVGYHHEEGLYLTSKGTMVIYGDTSDLSKKNLVALLALRDLVDNYVAIEYIDISLPDHPVLKPAQIVASE
jgi:cell division protein FtsQ